MMNTPPYAASTRPKCASGWNAATNPYAPSAIAPAPIHSQPRWSRTPCQTSQAPPISSRAASDEQHDRLEHRHRWLRFHSSQPTPVRPSSVVTVAHARGNWLTRPSVDVSSTGAWPMICDGGGDIPWLQCQLGRRG